ncbi:MAG: hypothetical protein ACXW4Q_12565 [Anaerolineales bacterium]
MKSHSLIAFVISLLMASCIANPEPSAIPSELYTPTAISVMTQETSLASIPTSTVSTQLTTIPHPTQSTGSFELLGHSPLLQRGMNAGLAVYGNYAYAGSRTDGSHSDAGALVLDNSNPTNPQVVYQNEATCGGGPRSDLPGITDLAGAGAALCAELPVRGRVA